MRAPQECESSLTSSVCARIAERGFDPDFADVHAWIAKRYDGGWSDDTPPDIATVYIDEVLQP